MAAGDRFKGWIEGLSVAWKDRMAGWMASWAAKGIGTFAEMLEPGVKAMGKPYIDRLRADPNVPQEIKDQLNHAMGAGNILETIYVEATVILQAIGVILGGSVPLSNEMRYAQDYLKRSSRLDPMSVISAWRRDPAAYDKYFDDLRMQGWSDDRIEALKYVTESWPSARDVVGFLAHEVFEPDMISKYGLLSEWGNIDKTFAAKIGVTEEILQLYWIDHWQHASWQQVVEMLHRGQLTEQDVREWFRLVEIPEFWRDKLIATSWNVPTRVDVRRFWDMRTIDEVRLREVYTAQGYHGADLDDYVLWTKVYVDFPTLLARWKNGWISLEEVKQKLVSLGMPADRAEEMLQEKIQAEGAERTSADRTLTLTDIYKGVKQERITRAEAVGLVMDLGYDEAEAGFKLDVNVPSDDVASAVQQRQLAKGDILAGLKAGILTDEGARLMLLGLRYAAVDVEFLLKLYRAQMAPPVEPRLKEASKADILLGVKKGLITPEEGFGMLLDIGFSPEASDFILMVKAEESPFSPVTFDEFKDRTQKWRQAAGMGGKPMAEEIKQLGAEVVRLTAEVDALQKSIKDEQGKLVPDEIVPAAATVRVKKLQATLHKAQVELARVQTDYNAKIAEWRHEA